MSRARYSPRKAILDRVLVGFYLNLTEMGHDVYLLGPRLARGTQPMLPGTSGRGRGERLLRQVVFSGSWERLRRGLRDGGVDRRVQESSPRGVRPLARGHLQRRTVERRVDPRH